ncbi:hypothetical protein LOAG_05185 [Loa loa]|uniref:Uncharacterized protein n=1 Tax=Loa loa TaxID=7209 RepID=A0A1S0U0J2_LOALO|nr:hypothetical protein LOAG_05185 [Loa loa]EFO23298.1 hypothetical protein LOAG_05185 [Loa loa]
MVWPRKRRYIHACCRRTDGYDSQCRIHILYYIILLIYCIIFSKKFGYKGYSGRYVQAVLRRSINVLNHFHAGLDLRFPVHPITCRFVACRYRASKSTYLAPTGDNCTASIILNLIKARKLLLRQEGEK